MVGLDVLLVGLYHLACVTWLVSPDLSCDTDFHNLEDTDLRSKGQARQLKDRGYLTESLFRSETIALFAPLDLSNFDLADCVSTHPRYLLEV